LRFAQNFTSGKRFAQSFDFDRVGGTNIYFHINIILIYGLFRLYVNLSKRQAIAEYGKHFFRLSNDPAVLARPARNSGLGLTQTGQATF